MEPLGNYNKATTCLLNCDKFSRSSLANKKKEEENKSFPFACYLIENFFSHIFFGSRCDEDFFLCRDFPFQLFLLFSSFVRLSLNDKKKLNRKTFYDFILFLCSDTQMGNFYMGTCGRHPRTSFGTRFLLITKFFN